MGFLSIKKPCCGETTRSRIKLSNLREIKIKKERIQIQVEGRQSENLREQEAIFFNVT